MFLSRLSSARHHTGRAYGRIVVGLLIAGLSLWLVSKVMAASSLRIVEAAATTVDDDGARQAAPKNDSAGTGAVPDSSNPAHLDQATEEMTLDYLYRYDCQCFPGIDHLVTAVAISPTRAIVAGTPALTLLDIGLSPGGTITPLDHITTYHVRNLYLKDHYIFANIHGSGQMQDYGFAVFRTNGEALQHVTTITETGVFYEKMDIVGDYLFVAAHADGIRVFDISDPANPAMIGTLSTGFTDAWAIQVSGSRAYVADGPAGLKIVDVTDPIHPVLVAGETLTTAVGTSEAITVKGNKIYVAAGAAGVAVYDKGDANSREIIQTGGVPEDFAWVGDYLAVSTVAGVVILKTDNTGQTEIVAHETSARRGSGAILRLAVGLGSASDNRLMVANWNYLDVYELKTITDSLQTDIESSAQRIRFSPGGGTSTVTLSNNGQSDLVISHTEASTTSFITDFYSGTLAPGDSVSLHITYLGSPAHGSGKIGFFSNDPDENPLTIQVYGETAYLDPGESAPEFALPLLTKDPDTGIYGTETFTLSEHRGQVVWFGVYASW